MQRTSLIQPFLDNQGVIILDGGLATELERKGYDLRHRLWSARLLIDRPDAIRAVHRSFLEAGADCIITASYQASVAGLCAEGLSENEARLVLARSVTIAKEARDIFLQSDGKRGSRLNPLVAASIGPYGAYLADGSEYRGDYKISAGELRAYHQPRWEIVTGMQPDLLACETIPSQIEAEVLANLLKETPGMAAWFSFSCRDGRTISDGTPINELVQMLNEYPRVAAVGVNCTAPVYIDALIDQIRTVNTNIPVVVYPNSGEVYDPQKKRWRGKVDPAIFSRAAAGWYAKGARLIGGCCRTTPEHIQDLRKVLTDTSANDAARVKEGE